jgi:glycogen(starch) synthase
MDDKFKVTVVINTCDRGKYLGDTLEGLKQQTFTNFEVVLVNGPSIDNTEEVAKSYNVRYYTAPFNISVSRNVGIKNAAGDIIAFIDDDAVPEPDWLADLVMAYDDPKVGAAGGFVYNSDGSDFQYKYGAIDRWGYPITNTEEPYNFNSSDGPFFNINIGTNASYRRSYLVEVGGFDEEIEYYHDESDVCVRVIRAGYKVIQLNNAYVHHKFAPSFRRNEKRVTNWNAIVKNTIYFGLKYTKNEAPLWKRVVRPFWMEKRKFISIAKSMTVGDFGPIQYIKSSFGLLGAMAKGYKRGFSSTRKLLSDYGYQPDKFKQFITEDNSNAKNIILVSQAFPPEGTDGIARYNSTLAKSLADDGNRVFVITKNSEKGTKIEYRDKFWIYYHDPEELKQRVVGYDRADSLIALAKSSLATAQGIAKKSRIDLVVAPLWDVEGLALIRKKIAPTILTLMSPLKKVVETQWYYLDDPSLEMVYELEKYCVENADGVMAISQAIKDTIGDLYDIAWDNLPSKAHQEVIPLGVEQSIVTKKVTAKEDGKVDILFVGRFERRKGIDLLLEVIPELLKSNKNATFHLIGNSNIPDENGKFIYKDFLKKYSKESWIKRVKKYGYVSDEELRDMYAKCDIFVAPSRYESFGLIFIEAMASGKPVIGTRVGGIPEIIIEGQNGLLFTNENTKELQVALSKLITDKPLRERMGKESKKLIETKFNSEKMATDFTSFANKLIKKL